MATDPDDFEALERDVHEFAREDAAKERLDLLSTHYENQKRYAHRLKGALERIAHPLVAVESEGTPNRSWTLCTEHQRIIREEDHGSCPECGGDRNLIVVIPAARAFEAEGIAREALDPKNVPPHPLAHFYDEGWHTGHPFPEYLNLLGRPADQYVDPHAGYVETHVDFWQMVHAIRAYVRETGVHVLSVDQRHRMRLGFVTACPASDPRSRHWWIRLADVSRTANQRPSDFEGLSTDDLIRITHPHLMTSDGRMEIALWLSTGVLPAKSRP